MGSHLGSRENVASDGVHLGWGLGICISNRLPGGLNIYTSSPAAELQETFGGSYLWLFLSLRVLISCGAREGTEIIPLGARVEFSFFSAASFVCFQ